MTKDLIHNLCKFVFNQTLVHVMIYIKNKT